MKLQLWRKATIQLKIENSTTLIDPILREKGLLELFHVLKWICNQRWRDADRVKWIYVYYLIPIVSIIYLKSENAPLDNQLSCLKE